MLNPPSALVISNTLQDLKTRQEDVVIENLQAKFRDSSVESNKQTCD